MSTSKKELVVKSNQVIEASYQLSSTEQRIVLAAISKISRAEDITEIQSIPKGANRFNLHLGRAKRA